MSIDIDSTIDNLKMSICLIEDNECNQFPGWSNVVMAMRDAQALLEEFWMEKLARDE